MLLQWQVYIPSPLPTTRLSVSTSALPAAPQATARTTVFKTPGRPNRSKFKESLGGLLEEEGEEVLSIARGPETDLDGLVSVCYWASLGREDVSIWSIRPKVVLCKLRRSPASLRAHGSNAMVAFHSARRIVITTASGHHLFYSISHVNPSGSNKKGNLSAYSLPGGEKGSSNWNRGPGEGKELDGIILRAEGERGMAIGDGVGCVCLTSRSLLVGVMDPPMLRILPFPGEAAAHSPQLMQGISIQARSVPNSHRRDSDSVSAGDTQSVPVDEWPWLINPHGDVSIASLIQIEGENHDVTTCGAKETIVRSMKFVMLTSDGRGYIVRWGTSAEPGPLSRPKQEEEKGTTLFDEKEELQRELDREASKWIWEGKCFHPATSYGDETVSDLLVEEQESQLAEGIIGSTTAINEHMGLVAVGCENGMIYVYNLNQTLPGQMLNNSPTFSIQDPTFSHKLSLREYLKTTASELCTGRVTCLAWTSDGYALAVGWSLGWSIWSVFGRLGSWSVVGSLTSGYGVEGEKNESFEDHFMQGVRELFWGPGNMELFVLCPPPIHPRKKSQDEQLFVIPFAKSAVTGLHTPDNTKHAFLQMDDRVLVYRGADQPDMSVINPESDVWQHIKIPATYIAVQYPIRYAVISSDARLIAVAGRRGLTHYNALSGRWKMFDVEREEESIKVVGGMAWWSNILIVACVENGVFQIRLFSRDRPLTTQESLEVIVLNSEPLLLAVFDSSLLLYTADNTFHHFLIGNSRNDGTRLRMCGSIGFEGVVRDPRKVRGMSWLVPKSQQRFGDPADDLNVATIIFLINGNLVLLRPRRAAHEEVKYDMQILADRIEFYWTHLSGIGTLENSLWGWDGSNIRIWLDALTIEKVKVDARRDAYEYVTESVAVPLGFYPLAILMDKGIIVGIDQEISLRKSLDFAIFRIITTTHLFLPHILQYHLTRGQSKEAVHFASYYQHLVYFAHALEILLHTVLEDEADARPVTPTPDALGNSLATSPKSEAVLPRVVEFLDHFDEALKVVVGCARKTEVARWSFLFDAVGKPRDLFEKCISSGFLRVAASYLLVLHNLEPVEQSSKDTVRLLKAAMDAGEWMLCRELLRFLYSLDQTGLILRTALSEGSALPPGYRLASKPLSPGMENCFEMPLQQRGGLGLDSLLGRVNLAEQEN